MNLLHTSMHSEQQSAQGQLLFFPSLFRNTLIELRCGLRNQRKGRILEWPWG
jgi:hypothetical protein